MSGNWRRLLATGLLLVSLAAGWGSSAKAQNGSRSVKKVQPVYPELARRMKIHGVVKIEVTVAPNGTVKETKVIGGHPLLVEASVDAVRRWKYAPAPDETVETAVINFEE